MMYRLLIVDDEPVIVNGLVQLFQENSDFELDVCKAFSANEAIEIAKKTKLDILVSDIRMPQKNGLQLVDEIVYYWPSCRIIFLTGYSEFDYVYEAIRKNVENYILKTEGIEPVYKAVKIAMDKLDEENRTRILQEKAEMHVQFAEPLLKNEMMEALLHGVPMAELLANPRYAEVDFHIAADRPAFFLVGQADHAEDQLTADKWKLLKTVQQIFDSCLPASLYGEKAVYDASALVWLLQPDADLTTRLLGEDHKLNWLRLVAYMKGILESVQNECTRMLNVSVSFAISGNLMNDWDGLHAQVEEARSFIRKRVQLGQEMVIVDLDKLSSLVPTHYKGRGMSQEQFRLLLIDQIHQYIKNHLSGDLSLTAIAEEVHFNPSYLSRYYKQITGHNLIDYIRSTKLEAAIVLMTNPQLKLHEIAAKLGFESPSYFTTFFKKMTGTSPQEYRNLQ
ncbi:response regulator [Paenibacillus sp. GCM10027628]|uniref:response regulator n=1 Tax=Paenibacillus sp. GCM10027628 TaxID=3273413 RepID=UPI003644BA74